MKGFICVKPGLKREVLAYDFSSDGEAELIMKPFDESNEFIHDKIKFIGKFKSFPKELKKRKLPLVAYDGPLFSHTKATYLDLVEDAIDAIHDDDDFKKVVVSRFTCITNSVDPIELFDALCLAHPRTNVYLLNHPKIGVWMGASPETLVKVNDGKFKTMALAGSKLQFQEWTDKEKIEQRIVETFITDIIKTYNLEKLKIRGVQTISAGPVQHLRTHIEGLIGDNDPYEIAQKLHPTPAVNGFPTDKAKSFIKQNEGYNREYYTGFIALRTPETFDSFVNLRCMKIYKDRIKLFAGGGITADSISETEWNETQTKIQTLMGVIKELRESKEVS